MACLGDELGNTCDKINSVDNKVSMAVEIYSHTCIRYIYNLKICSFWFFWLVYMVVL